jgi:hypothetical protein
MTAERRDPIEVDFTPIKGARPLSLDADVERTPGGWRVRVPVRRDLVEVHRRTLVVKEAVLRTRFVEDAETHVGAVVREKPIVARHRPGGTANEGTTR